MKHLLLLSLCINVQLYSNVISAQINKQLFVDLNSIGKKISSTNFKMKLSYELYDLELENEPKEKSEINVATNKGMVYIDNHISTFYSNEKFKLIVYKKEKKMIFNKPDKKLNKTLSEFLVIDSLLEKNCKSINLINDTGGIRVYEINFKEVLLFKKWIISLDIKNNRIVKNIMYYKENVGSMVGNEYFSTKRRASFIPVLVITYGELVPLNKSDIETFYAKDIARLEDRNKISLTDSYRKYKIYNFLNIRNR